GGLKTATAKEKLQKDPAYIIEHAVKGMLPDNRLKNKLMKKLKVYVGANHPHTAQVATTAAKQA
ncbi:MAG TPA: uL13 family ribosomal protein, partial [Candidatus Limnocylindria bacterium]|nr:uL13 family ribosomal protein [Candidatus Limnocylindria bacterium]